MKRTIITICFLAILIADSALAAVYYVPDDYATIQAAIDACGDFDTIVIAPGTYSGLGNRDISFNGKQITVRSTNADDPHIVNTTVINCEGKGRGFVFYMGEDADSKVTGLTITNGYGLVGGAVYCFNNSSPSIANCVITANSAVFGGGIASTNGKSYPVITNCQIIANSALVGGGGIYLNGSSPAIRSCIISGNVALEGGAIYSHNAGNPLVVNCTITGNAADNSAGAIYCYKSSNVTISNSILWGDKAENASEVLVGNLGAPTSIRISHCNIQGGDKSVMLDTDCTVDWGQGNINVDPYFVNAGYIESTGNYVEGDYHLLEESPCIDAGDPAFIPGPDETDIDGNPRILGARIDLGADEFQPPIPATVKITPQTLNLESKGNWINCIIALPDGYDVDDVNSATIALDGQVKPAWSETDDEEQRLHVKFYRSETQSMLEAAESPVLLTVSGKLNDGSDFAGADTIRLVRSGGKK